MSKTNYNVGENKLGCTCKEKSDVKLKDCEIAYQSGMYWHAILNIDGKDVQSFTYDLGLGSSTVTGKNFGLNSSDTLYNLGLSAISYGDIYQYDGQNVKFVMNSINNTPSTNKEVSITIIQTR